MAATTQGRLFDLFKHGDYSARLGELLGGIEYGTAVLSSGQNTITSSVDITATSLIIVWCIAAGGTTTSTYGYEELPANRDVTANTFIVQASTNAHAVASSDTSTVAFLVLPTLDAVSVLISAVLERRPH